METINVTCDFFFFTKLKLVGCMYMTLMYVTVNKIDFQTFVLCCLHFLVLDEDHVCDLMDCCDLLLWFSVYKPEMGPTHEEK